MERKLNNVKTQIKKLGNYCINVLSSKNKEIRYLKIYTIISGILSLLYLTIFLLFFFDKYSSFQGLSSLFNLVLPFIVSLVIWLIGYYTNIKHQIITKILVNILNIGFYIFHFFIVLGLFFWMILWEPTYDNIKDYNRALSKYRPNIVEHFPTEIPHNIDNIKLLKTPPSFNGDSTFYLKFDARSEYIQQEIEKYKNVGKKYLINHDIKNNKNRYDYDADRAEGILNMILGAQDTEGYTIRVLREDSCFRAIAIKDNTIIYILVLD